MLRKLLLLSILLISTIRVSEAATVTASARDFESTNSEYLSRSTDDSNLETTTMYFSAWVKFESIDTTGSNSYVICAKANNNASLTNFQYKFYQYNSGIDFVMVYGTGGSDYVVAHNTSVALATGTWYFVEGWFNTSEVGVSINRGPATTTSHSQTMQAGGAAFLVGAVGSGSPSQHFDGTIQSLSVYSAIPDTTTRDSRYNSGNGKLYHDLSASEKTNLVSHWDLVETSGTAKDAHGTNHLTDNNTVTSAVGKVTYTANDASDFEDSNSEYLSISHASQSGLSPSSSTSFYIAAWVRFESAPSSGNAYVVVAKGNNQVATDIDYKLSIYNNRGNMVIGNNSSLFTADATNGPTFVENTWYFIEGYYDSGASVVGVSVNRSTDNTTAFTGTRDTSTWSFLVGNMGNTTQYWDGPMCAIVFISGGVPTTADRDALFNRGFGVDYSDKPTLSSGTYVSWWEMTEASSTRNDSHGTNHLTDNNTVTGANGIVYDVSTVTARRRIL